MKASATTTTNMTTTTMTRSLRAMAALGVALMAFSAAARAEVLELDGDFIQGGLAFGTTDPGARVTLGERAVRVAPSGRFLIGFGREAPAEATLTITFPDGSATERRLAITQREFPTERIDGLPHDKVTPAPEVLARIKREQAEVKAVRKNDRPAPDYETGFVWPLTGRISGLFGRQRILNGEPRQPHYGIDIAAPAGTPVKAPADGLVTYVNRDMYFSGVTVFLDHGHGLMSAFLHMKEASVEVGQRLSQGQVLGAVGATGRVTGPHLDWRINWFEERIDPGRLVPPMPSQTGQAD